MDVRLPSIDGREASRRIRDLEPGSNLPLIVLLSTDEVPEAAGWV
jgi:CheY-like chemotaxis protein